MGILDDSLYAVRSLTRRPSLTVFAALTIALGVGATTSVFSVLETVVLNPLTFENGDRMAALVLRIGTLESYVNARPEHVDLWRGRDDLFEHVEPWSMRTLTLTGDGETREIRAGLILPTFHGFVGRAPVIGRAFTQEEVTNESARVVILDHGFWQRSFGGDPGVLGRTLQLDGGPWTIVGVMPKQTPLPAFGLTAVELWVPLSDETAKASAMAVGLVPEDLSIEEINQRLVAASSGAPNLPDGWRPEARLLAEDVGRGLRDILAFLMGAVVLLLLITCVNVSNLLLFRANARRKETAVRVALGGGRGRLTRQLLVESLLLALFGGVLGVALAYIGQSVILGLRPERLAALDRVSLSPTVLVFALLVTMATGVVFGLIPAVQTGRPRVLGALRSGTRTEGDVVGGRIRWVLVASEVALSFALLIGSLSVLGTMIDRRSTDVGFEADRVAVMQLALPGWRYDAGEDHSDVFEPMVERVSRLPGVERVSVASAIPPRAGVLFGTPEVEGGPSFDETLMIHGPAVGPGYFETVGLQILEGEGFSEADRELGSSAMILGETTARRFFPDGDAVGGRFRMSADGSWISVRGVASDVTMTGLSAATLPLQGYTLARGQGRSGTLLARVRDGTDSDAVLGLMRDIVTASDPDIRIDVLAVADDLMLETLERERFISTLMSVFALLALVLAAVGLYGVVSHVVGHRTREIGIRMALGGRRWNVVGIVVRRATWATSLGVFVGFGLAVWALRVLETRVLGLSAPGAGGYALAAALLGGTALLAACVPARRAATVDPVRAMRIE